MLNNCLDIWECLVKKYRLVKYTNNRRKQERQPTKPTFSANISARFGRHFSLKLMFIFILLVVYAFISIEKTFTFIFILLVGYAFISIEKTFTNSALKLRKSKDSDLLPSHFFKNSLPEILPSLVNLYKNIARSRTFPRIWKHAIVISVFEKGSKTDVQNYGPISLLNIGSTVLEKIMYDTIIRGFLSLAATANMDFELNDLQFYGSSKRCRNLWFMVSSKYIPHPFSLPKGVR